MAQYISKDALVAEIDVIVKALKLRKPDPLGNHTQCLAAAEIEALNLVKDIIDTLEVKETMARTVVLLSSHDEVARLPSGSLEYVWPMVNNPNAEDLLKVIDITGRTYWCDEIEFENQI